MQSHKQTYQSPSFGTYRAENYQTTLRACMKRADGALGMIPSEVISMIEQALFDATTSKKRDLPPRHQITSHTSNCQLFRVLWPTSRACHRGNCGHAEDGNECTWLRLCLRIQGDLENGVCTQVWYSSKGDCDNQPAGLVDVDGKACCG